MSSLFTSPFFAAGHPSSQGSANTTSYSPLFRLLDDFEQHSRANPSSHNHSHHAPTRAMKTFTPKFDVKETADAYELHGDLPGIEQKDVEIEFTDAQTINIKGRTERSYTSGTPPAGFVEDAPSQNTITDGKTPETNSGKAHQPTVEDEKDGETSNANTVATKTAHEEHKAPSARYWVSERSVGEFSRSFSFPIRVDVDAVKASMKNGVLTVEVPKAKKQESRKKITIG